MAFTTTNATTTPYAIIANPDGNAWEFASSVYEQVRAKGLEDRIELIRLQVHEFRDGEIKVRPESTVREKYCYLVHDSSLHPDTWANQLNFANAAMRNAGARHIVDVLPYHRYARQDRKDESRVSLNAKVIASMIGLFADEVMSVDLHTDQMVGFYDISVPVDHLYSFPTAVRYLFGTHPELREQEITIMSPDPGGAKRAGGFLKRVSIYNPGVELAIGYKQRSQSGEVDSITVIGKVKGRAVIVVDDIIDSGGTLITASEAARREGATAVMAYAAHGLFTRGFDRLKPYFEKVFVSNTYPSSINDPQLERIDLIPLFGEAIYRTVIGQSLSELFD